MKVKHIKLMLAYIPADQIQAVINYKDRGGYTALSLACRHGFHEVAEVLKLNGAIS
ncbi:MAG TPA: hypothetical protein VHA52_07865 [Candidatus Babeliaceae bacterium]|nr:hypothetical protein [Candidatus Babeliaceae bacterium]